MKNLHSKMQNLNKPPIFGGKIEIMSLHNLLCWKTTVSAEKLQLSAVVSSIQPTAPRHGPAFLPISLISFN